VGLEQEKDVVDLQCHAGELVLVARERGSQWVPVVGAGRVRAVSRRCHFPRKGKPTNEVGGSREDCLREQWGQNRRQALGWGSKQEVNWVLGRQVRGRVVILLQRLQDRFRFVWSCKSSCSVGKNWRGSLVVPLQESRRSYSTGFALDGRRILAGFERTRAGTFESKASSLVLGRSWSGYLV